MLPLIFRWGDLANIRASPLARLFPHLLAPALISFGNSSLTSFYPCSSGGVDPTIPRETGLSGFNQHPCSLDQSERIRASQETSLFTGKKTGGAGAPSCSQSEACAGKGKVWRWRETELWCHHLSPRLWLPSFHRWVRWGPMMLDQLPPNSTPQQQKRQDVTPRGSEFER